MVGGCNVRRVCGACDIAMVSANVHACIVVSGDAGVGGGHDGRKKPAEGDNQGPNLEEKNASSQLLQSTGLRAYKAEHPQL